MIELEEVFKSTLTIKLTDAEKEVDITLYMHSGNYILTIPGEMASTLSINDPSMLKRMVNDCLDSIIEVENNIYDKYKNDRDENISVSVQG